jgi:hypothetical protein
VTGAGFHLQKETPRADPKIDAGRFLYSPTDAAVAVIRGD